MSSHSFILVTGNPNKLEEAARILGYEPRSRDVDLPEIQSLDLLEVLTAKSEEAWRRLDEPVVVEETGLSLAALNGFPGPLVKWMLKAIGPLGIARIASSSGDLRAEARCALQYRDGAQVVSAEGSTHGRLLTEPRGSGGFGWDPVFVPAGHELSYAELAAAVKDEIGHRGRGWRALQEALDSTIGTR